MQFSLVISFRFDSLFFAVLMGGFPNDAQMINSLLRTHAHSDERSATRARLHIEFRVWSDFVVVADNTTFAIYSIFP